MNGDELRELKQEIRINIKSILLASKDGLTDRELRRDYFDAYSKELPYGQLGFNTSYDLMSSMPEDVVVNRRRDGTWIYYGVHDEKTRNLGRLVQEQNDPKKAVRERARAYEGHRNRFFSAPKMSNQYYARAASASSYLRNNKPAFDSNFEKTALQVPNEVQHQIKDLFHYAPNFEMTADEFGRDFTIRYGHPLKFEEYGFDSLLDLLKSLDHFILIDEEHGARRSQFFNLKKIRLFLKNENGEHSLIRRTQKDTPKNSVANNKIGPSGDKITENHKPANTEEQIALNFMKIIESNGDKGVDLSSLDKIYREKYHLTIDHKKFGFKTLFELVFKNLNNLIRLVDSETGYKIYKATEKDLEKINQSEKNQSIENKSENEDEISNNDSITNSKNNQEDLFKKFVSEIMKSFEKYEKSILTLEKFTQICQRNSINFKTYGLAGIDQALCKLKKVGLIKFDQNGNIAYSSQTFREINDLSSMVSKQSSENDQKANPLKLHNYDEVEDDYNNDENKKVSKFLIYLAVKT